MKILTGGQPLNKASKGLILLHGRGSNPEDIMSLSYRLDTHDCYIIAPEAPGRQWYPQSFMAEDRLNEPYLTKSIAIVKSLIDDLSQHFAKENIFIMGFSQGACLALETTARYAEKFGGVAAFSGALIGHNLDKSRYQDNYYGTKIFIGNSNIDPHIPLERTEESARLLQSLGAQVTLKIYPGMGHYINDDEIDCVNTHILKAKD